MKFSLKWPNDVLAGRQKLAGILLEAEAVAGDRLAVVVGIGTNVVAAPEGTPTPATSLAALGVHIGAEELFATLSDAWAELRGIWDTGCLIVRTPDGKRVPISAGDVYFGSATSAGAA
jgi:BirA family biotin operon repressor/biotin-[acetyl-CoA-carboxylase] ligase